MINDLRKNKVKITKNDSLEVIEDLSKKSMSKDSLIENVKSFGADEDEFDEISYMDSIRKKHMDYYFSNDDTKDSEIVDYFKENKFLQKKYKYDCLIFDNESEAIKIRAKIKNSQDFKKYLNSKVRNYDIYRSDFVYNDDFLLKESSLKKADQISKIFKYKDSYIILMINSVNQNENDLLIDAKKIYLKNEYDKYLKNLIKNSNIKLFI
ncbi:conserved domain protein [Anaerococcus hydrogenalis ACS-025-V-Sch4]|uniref:Conserved domain protein n=2 Tax=Anaerococcus hydrogenalis TaxID=33029 RepID=F0GZJ2_9FIRM|nr:conserved domain protein [Anaerococcus hydrogenalis ACS-025-V-Sch4]